MRLALCPLPAAMDPLANVRCRLRLHLLSPRSLPCSRVWSKAGVVQLSKIIGKETNSQGLVSPESHVWERLLLNAQPPGGVVCLGVGSPDRSVFWTFLDRIAVPGRGILSGTDRLWKQAFSIG